MVVRFPNYGHEGRPGLISPPAGPAFYQHNSSAHSPRALTAQQSANRQKYNLTPPPKDTRAIISL